MLGLGLCPKAKLYPDPEYSSVFKSAAPNNFNELSITVFASCAVDINAVTHKVMISRIEFFIFVNLNEWDSEYSHFSGAFRECVGSAEVKIMFGEKIG